jgi:hypothetical protein
MKRKYTAIALFAALVAIGTISCSKQAEAEPGKQTTCPVMKGEKINPNLYVDAEGKRIYACCPGCVAKIAAEPGKYIAQLEAEGVILEEAPIAE